VRLEREKDELQHKVKLLQAAILIRDVIDGVPRVAAPQSQDILASRVKTTCAGKS